jgi:rubrerythrin
MSHSDGGKGSARRKEDVSKINDNWDVIFGRKSAGRKEKTMNEHEEEPQQSDEWTCDVCGGPMYRQAPWDYGQCDDCDARQELEGDDNYD